MTITTDMLAGRAEIHRALALIDDPRMPDHGAVSLRGETISYLHLDVDGVARITAVLGPPVVQPIHVHEIGDRRYLAWAYDDGGEILAFVDQSVVDACT